MQDDYTLFAAIFTVLEKIEKSAAEKMLKVSRKNEKSVRELANDTIDLAEEFPTEVFYWGEELNKSLSRRVSSEKRKKSESQKKEKEIMSNDNTQTQRIADSVEHRKNSKTRTVVKSKNEETSDKKNWVRRSTRLQKNAKEVAKVVPRTEVKKVIKKVAASANKSVKEQREKWETIQRTTWAWMHSISRREPISRTQIESYYFLCFQFMTKALVKHRARSPEIHSDMMRFVADFMKLYDIAFVCQFKSVISCLFRFVNDVLTEFMKHPSFMNDTSVVWIQAKQIIKLMLITTVREQVLYGFLRSTSEIQSYMLDQCAKKPDQISKHKSHINYCMSQISEFNSTVSQRLLQLERHELFGIGC